MDLLLLENPMLVEFDQLDASARYHLMTQTIIPRPIAWVLTQSALNESAIETSSQGEVNDAVVSAYNLAPFSYFTAVSSAPALLMLSIGQKTDGVSKDTLRNIVEQKKLVIHIAHSQQAELVSQSAASLQHGDSEIDLINQQQSRLSTLAFGDFALPRLAQCDIAFACELHEVKTLEASAQTLVFVEIKQLYVNDKVTEQQNDRLKILADQVSPLARLGGSEYASIQQPFALKRAQ